MASFRTAAAFALFVAAASSGASTSACSGKDPYNPGTPLGTFHVNAKLMGTTCGPVPDPWEFDVRLAHDESTLIWIQGGAPISGIVDSTSRAKLKATDARELRPANARTKMAACVVARDDILDVALGGEKPDTPIAKVSDATSFVGKLTYWSCPGFVDT